MPLFDMTVEELYKYKGKSVICPADFDEYWDSSVAEMEALGTDCTLQKVDTGLVNADCFDLYYTGVGNARIHAKALFPKDGREKHGAVAVFHGYHRSADSWLHLASYCTAGLAVFALDCRGQGGQSQDTDLVEGTTIRGHVIRGINDPDPKKLLMRSIYLDAAQLVRIAAAMDGIDETRIAAMGASQGGGLALACAALSPQLNRVVPMMPFLCDFRRQWELSDPAVSYELLYYFRFFDPRHQNEEYFYTRLGYIDNVNLARRIQAKTLFCTGLIDNCCPPSAQFAAYNAVTAPKRIELWPESGHEVCPDMEDTALAFLTEMLK